MYHANIDTSPLPIMDIALDLFFDVQDAAIRDVGGRSCDPILGQSGTAMGRPGRDQWETCCVDGFHGWPQKISPRFFHGTSQVTRLWMGGWVVTSIGKWQDGNHQALQVFYQWIMSFATWSQAWIKKLRAIGLSKLEFEKTAKRELVEQGT